jgi:hypothetical protein
MFFFMVHSHSPCASFWSWKFRIAGIAFPTSSQRGEAKGGRFNGIDDSQKLQGVQEEGRHTLGFSWIKGLISGSLFEDHSLFPISIEISGRTHINQFRDWKKQVDVRWVPNSRFWAFPSLLGLATKRPVSISKLENKHRLFLNVGDNSWQWKALIDRFPY